jgi:hypothetical protein
LLVGRRIWVAVPESEHGSAEAGGVFKLPAHTYDCRVLSFKTFLPADGLRKKHLVQLWTDPGGMRTLSVGSIRLKDPRRVAAGIAREAAQHAEEDDD